jgi:hypothetical protein
MNLPRPKPALISLAVLGVVLAGCTPTGQPTQPAADAVTTTPVSDGPSTGVTSAAEPTTTVPAPAVTTAEPPAKATTSRTSTKPATKKPSTKPATRKPSPKPTSKPPSGQLGVHPGAFCSPEGGIGYTSKGTRMRCTRKAGEDQARWRAA